MEKVKVTFEPSGREISVPQGSTLKEAIMEAGLEFEFPCGGRGKCKKCLVQVLEGKTPPTSLEEDHFSEKEIQEGYRLACRTTLQDNTHVQLAPAKESEHKIQLQ
ncbi:MAG: ferredoxin, partial [Candidatus Syntrophonatronum acetioxidans]